MKFRYVLGIALLGLGNAAIAQGQPTSDPLPPVQAPPAINDPGVRAAAPAVTPAPASIANTVESPGLPADVQAAANAAELPVVTVRQNGNETVEEYRKKGKLLFVRVLNKEGPTRFYVDNPSTIPPSLMKQLSGPSGVVQPVYYKLADWK
ncbi:MAG: DUF2782 domain-containing protein [Rudaea sp.]